MSWWVKVKFSRCLLTRKQHNCTQRNNISLFLEKINFWKLLVIQVKQRRRLLSTFRGRKNRFFLLFDYTDFKHFSERFQEKYILKTFKAPELFRKMYFQIKFNKSGRCLNLVPIKKGTNNNSTACRVVCFSRKSDRRIRVCILHQSDCRIRVCISDQSDCCISVCISH